MDKRPMSKHQTIIAPDGSELVVVPRDDYDRLVDAAEELEDVAAFDAALRRRAAGEDAAVPFEVVQRPSDGDNPVRVWREHHGLKAGELAARAGISQPYLSQIEAGRKHGTLKALAAIARALGVDVDDLVVAGDEADATVPPS